MGNDSAPVMSVRTHLDRSIDQILWISQTLTGVVIPSMPTSLRHQLAGATLHVAVEHHQAIVLLLEQKVYASAFALLRCLFEAYIRGAWLSTVASDAEVEHADRDKFPQFGVMVKALENGSALPVGIMSKVKDDNWGMLNSLTHTGQAQRNNRLTVDGLGHRYDDEQIHQALNVADSLAFMVAFEFARLAENTTLRDAVNARVLQIYSEAT
jgi:hypothetical protein